MFSILTIFSESFLFSSSFSFWIAARLCALSVRSVETEGNGKVLFKRGQKVFGAFWEWQKSCPGKWEKQLEKENCHLAGRGRHTILRCLMTRAWPQGHRQKSFRNSGFSENLKIEYWNQGRAFFFSSEKKVIRNNESVAKILSFQEIFTSFFTLYFSENVITQTKAPFLFPDFQIEFLRNSFSCYFLKRP